MFLGSKSNQDVYDWDVREFQQVAAIFANIDDLYQKLSRRKFLSIVNIGEFLINGVGFSTKISAHGGTMDPKNQAINWDLSLSEEVARNLVILSTFRLQEAGLVRFVMITSTG